MKKLYYLTLVIILSYITIIQAAPNDLYEPNNPSSNISLINDINVSTLEVSLSNLDTNSLTDSHLLSFTIDNNHENGFKIEISSLNNGKLVREGSGSELGIADYIDYTVSTVHMLVDEVNSGGADQTYWGFTSPYDHSSLVLSNVSLDQSKILTFSASTHGINQATRNFVYRLLLTTTAKKYLFRGNVTDTITITITSIE